MDKLGYAGTSAVQSEGTLPKMLRANMASASENHVGSVSNKRVTVVMRRMATARWMKINWIMMTVLRVLPVTMTSSVIY